MLSNRQAPWWPSFFVLLMVIIVLSFLPTGARAASPTIVIEQSLTPLKRNGIVVAWGPNTFGQISVPSGLSDVTAISAGGNDSTALKSNGTVVAWGENSFGQTDVPIGLTDVKAIATGGFHTVALKSDGTVLSWGFISTVPAGLTDVTNIAAGDSHTLAIKNDGTVVAWGDNSFGQTNVPAGLSGVVAVAGGDSHSVALKNDGAVVTWGGVNASALTVPSGLTGVKAISAGAMHTMALKNDGTVVAWGSNTWGQTNTPTGLTDVIAIAAGADRSVALKSNGTVVAWGSTSTAPSGLNSVTAIAIGNFHIVALMGNPKGDLGNQLVTTTGSAISFTIKNTGGTDLTLGSITKDGTNPGDFTVSTPIASTIVSGNSTTFTVTFTPSGLGARSATLHIPNNDPSLPSYDLVLAGTGTPSNNANLSGLVLSSGTLSPIFTGSTISYSANVPNAISSLTVTPTRAEANATIKVNGTTVTSGAPSGDIPLNVGANTITTVVTAQNGTTTKTYTVTVTRLAPEINLTGNGVSISAGDTTPALADHTDFGSVDLNGDTVLRTFTIANSGTDVLTLTGNPKVSVNGLNAGDFTITTQPSSSVAAGGNTTFLITFNPGAVGLRTATLTIANDDNDESTYDFAIQGTGTVGLSLPRISANNTLEIIWPAAGTTDLKLQSSPTLGETADWQDVNLEPSMTDGMNAISIAIQNGQRFFRLIQFQP